MAEKVTVVHCAAKKSGTKNGKGWTIYSVELADGRKGESFKEMKGEVEIEITKNGQYADKFEFPKSGGSGGGGGKGYTPKDYTTEKKIAALNGAVALAVAKVVTMEQLKATMDKLYKYLNE